MPNTNFQTIFQMGQAINDMVKQATGRDAVQTIEMGQVTVAQNHMEVSGSATGNPAVFVTHEVVPLQIMAPFNPVQDKHGYENPWPAGGGRNLIGCLTDSLTTNGITFTVNSDGSVTGNGTATANAYYYLFPIGITLKPGTYTRLCRFSSGSESGYYRLQCRIDSVSGADLFGTSTEAQSATITEDTFIVVRIGVSDGTVLDNITFYPMVVSGTYTTGTFPAWEPYSNICPITGWTGAEIYQTGENLVYDSLANANIDGTGEIFVLPSNTSSLCFAPVNEGVTYAINRSATTLVAYFADAPGDGSRAYDGASHYINNTFTAPITGYVAVRVPADEVATFQLYQQNTYTVVFPDEAGTVYGGTLTVNKDGTGELVVDRGIYTIPAISEISTSSTGTGKYVTFDGATNAYFSEYDTDISFEALKTVSNHDRGQAWCGYERSISSFGCFVPSDATVEEVNNAIQGTKVCYKLATPTTYTLPAPVIRSLLGTNNVSANTGAVTVNYTDIIEGGGN